MAGHAALRRLLSIVAIVALRTIWNIAMFFVVTALAVLLSVSTRKLFELFDWSRMTISTCFGKSIHGWNTQRCVRILMTVDTVNLNRPMLLTVAHRTERHQLVIIVFSRIVRMKNFMTFLTGKAMFTARGF